MRSAEAILLYLSLSYCHKS